MEQLLEEYDYFRLAVFMTEGNMETVGSATKLLYPEIARLYNTTKGSVERAIREVVEVKWQCEDERTYEKLFGYSKDNGMGHPTNSEFIAMVAMKY